MWFSAALLVQRNKRKNKRFIPVELLYISPHQISVNHPYYNKLKPIRREEMRFGRIEAYLILGMYLAVGLLLGYSIGREKAAKKPDTVGYCEGRR